MIRWPALTLLLGYSLTALAQQSAAPAQGVEQQDGGKVVTLSIVGDREQPTVLYIVPWKRSPRDQVFMSPMPALEPLLDPVDPEVQRHELEYQRHLEKMRP